MLAPRSTWQLRSLAVLTACALMLATAGAAHGAGAPHPRAAASTPASLSTVTVSADSHVYYVVELGDTLWLIAQRFGTTIGALIRANGISNPSLIFPGTRLRIPAGSGTTPSSDDGDNAPRWRVHVVRAGEVLWQIAQHYGTTSGVLIRRNDIPDPDNLRIGMRLRVPGGASDSGGTDDGGGGGGRSSGSGGGRWGVHVVRAGEVLWQIAQRYGTTSGVLIRRNDIPDPDNLRIGMRLRVPGGASGGGGTDDGGGGGGAGTGGGGTDSGGGSPQGWGIHVVRPGELLWQIAQRYGTTAGELIRENDITNPDALTIGMRLWVPGGSIPPAFVCPVPGAEFWDDFGAPRPGGRIHEGIDLFAPRRTPVLAPVSGWVTAWVGSIGGNQVKLIGDDGHDYVGTHLAAFATTGWVAQGGVIGYVGSTGNATGLAPHLHFEFHPHRGAPVNPYGMLRKSC